MAVVINNLRVRRPSMPYAVVQLEPLDNSIDRRAWLRDAASSTASLPDEIWEYAGDQIDRYPSNVHVVHMPLLPSIVWQQTESNDAPPQRVIDVLFIGAMTRRRDAFWRAFSRTVIAATNASVRLETHEPHHGSLFASDLWARMLATKILLNVHNFEPPLLEGARIFPALAAGVCVVSEDRLAPSSVDRALVADVVRFVSNADEAAVLVVRLLANASALDACNAHSRYFSRHTTLEAWMH